MAETSRWVWVGMGVLTALSSGCGSHAVASGSAVGKLGTGLSAHTQSVPRGAEACALRDALEAQTPGTPSKSPSEACQKALNSDQLWRRSMVVLSAYSARLDALASGASPEAAGQIDALLTGIRDDQWIDAEPGKEQEARKAAADLVTQMMAGDKEANLEKTVTAAAPHVKKLCEGIKSYLDEQAKSFAELQKQIQEKREARSDRRCATFDSRTICVSHSMIDRIVYATTFGDLAVQESEHLAARDDVASFCAAHAKLESAASSGDTGKDETYLGIVEAVKAVPRAKPTRQPTADKPDTPPDKK